MPGSRNQSVRSRAAIALGACLRRPRGSARFSNKSSPHSSPFASSSGSPAVARNDSRRGTDRSPTAGCPIPVAGRKFGCARR